MRLIDADALMSKFAEFVRASNNSDFATAPRWNDAVSLLESAPTIEAEPNHGQWIFTEYESGDAEYCCSECGEGVYNKTKFCPNCGADMREVEE